MKKEVRVYYYAGYRITITNTVHATSIWGPAIARYQGVCQRYSDQQNWSRPTMNISMDLLLLLPLGNGPIFTKQRRNIHLPGLNNKDDKDYLIFLTRGTGNEGFSYENPSLLARPPSLKHIPEKYSSFN